jgi:hypothetical protein
VFFWQKKLLIKCLCNRPKAGIDTYYFFLKNPVTPDYIYFSGLTGLTNIIRDYRDWKIIFNNVKNESLETWAILNGTDQLPIGLQTWYLSNQYPCNNSLKNVLKLSNVSRIWQKRKGT